MTLFELCSLILSGLTLVVVFWGVRMAFAQLRATYEIKEKEYQWNQMVAAQNRLMEYNNLEFSALRENKNLNYNLNNYILSIEKIKKEIEADEKVRTGIHTVLNFYESLVRGIELGIYDRDTILSARKDTMVRMLTAYSEYIHYRRHEEHHPDAWMVLTDYFDKLNREKRQSIIKPIQKGSLFSEKSIR